MCAVVGPNIILPGTVIIPGKVKKNKIKFGGMILLLYLC